MVGLKQIRERIRQRPGRLRAAGALPRTPQYKRRFAGHANDHSQRNLNNAFAYDLVPSPSVCIAALKAARRVNDYPTAVRVFEGRRSGVCEDGICHANCFLTGIKAKVENTHQYDEYLEELKPLREEMGISLKEELYPEGTDSPYFNQ